MSITLHPLANYSIEELKKKFKELGIDAYRADQVFDWVFSKGVYDYARMKNLPESVKLELAKHFSLAVPEIVEKQKSPGDESTKLLLKLETGEFVETVLMLAKDRVTVCVSSQVGCKFHCAFCASGQDGFFRNLTQAEILYQVLLARDLSPKKRITNIVFMGIGEPFDNYGNLLRAIRVLNSKNALGIGSRKITVSTCGIVPKIERFSNEGLQVELSISLHGPNDRVRGAIMPVNRAFPVKDLIQVCKTYVSKTKRAITFEYIMVKGINSQISEAQSLAKLLKGMLCKVNLIPYNPIEEFPHVAPSYAEIVQFQQVLQEYGIKTTVRFSKGKDIKAACGQLRSVRLKKSSGV